MYDGSKSAQQELARDNVFVDIGNGQVGYANHFGRQDN